MRGGGVRWEAEDEEEVGPAGGGLQKKQAPQQVLPPPNPPWRQPRGKWMISLVNSHTNATSQKWHLWALDLIFALNSTPGWVPMAS